jgi:D-xylulose reductase
LFGSGFTKHHVLSPEHPKQLALLRGQRLHDCPVPQRNALFSIMTATNGLHSHLPTSNRAVVWTAKRTLAIEERPVTAPGAGEVLVKIISTGICGSDCHNWESSTISKQLVLGHESAGIIEQVGEGVVDRTVGERVAVEPGFACNECEFCLRGNPNTCANLRYCGLDPTDGTLCQYVTCRTSMTVSIPESVSWEEAGAIQPLSIAIQLSRRAGFNVRQTLAIFGCGPLGLLIVAVAKACGVRRIVCFDIDQSRVDFACSYGADVGIVTTAMTAAQKEDPFTFAQEYAKEIISKHDIGHGFDVTVEASGAEICAQMAICMLKAGGTCIQAGLGKPLTAVPLFLLTAKELNIKGTYNSFTLSFRVLTVFAMIGTVRYTPGCFADAISLLARGKVDLKPLITSTYPLTKSSEAFEAQHARKDIKIVIMNQE